ncbi:MAG: VPLPA-CTERM sorting domain-containing protein [Gammaproteobacteria bacterium]|nr:MAG: VPLPA-CTERM sorting domain-containing protein [Gammaproteobacteria bacterium]
MITAVPVPAAIWLFASALGLLGWTRRRRSTR